MSIEAVFTHIPALTTERLTLRGIQPRDAEAVFAFRSKPDVTRRYAQEPHASPEDTYAWMQRISGMYERHEGVVWGVTRKGDDTVIGTCLLWHFDSKARCAEIGYELHPAYWRQGIAAEAVVAVLAYSFDTLELNRVEAVTMDVNIPSQSFLRKLGFTHEGTLRQRIFFGGQYHDEAYFGLLAEEWAQQA